MVKRQKTVKRITTRPKRQEKTPFLEHVQEFRKRLVWVAFVVVSFAVVGYIIHERLIEFLLSPAKDQQFIYTTPGGGLNFIIQVSIYFGIVVGIPVIIYHLLRYLEPLLSTYDRGFIMKCAALSAVLAMAGMAFGYYIGLPAALMFLSDQFETEQITALLTLNEYLSFVTVYMLGAALMFQIPVVLVFTNRVKPLSAKKLATSQRWVIIAAFISAAIITPTPDLFNMCIIAVPIILVYQIGVLLVASQNKYSKAIRANRLRKVDQELSQKRQETAANAKPMPSIVPLTESTAKTTITVASDDETPMTSKNASIKKSTAPKARAIAVIIEDEKTEIADSLKVSDSIEPSSETTVTAKRISVSQIE